jgi:phage terminase small subunit
MESEPAGGAAASPRPALSTRRQAFVDEYLIDFNATRAAIRAGYSKDSAHALASRLLRQPAVKAAVEEAIAARAQRTRVTADRVIAEYARLAFTDMRRYAEWDADGVRLRPHTVLNADDAAAVVEIVPVGAKGRGRIKLHDKRAALDALARHLGLFGVRGAYGIRPLGSDLRTEDQNRARAALKARIERIIAERDDPAAAEAATASDMTAEK